MGNDVAFEMVHCSNQVFGVSCRSQEGRCSGQCGVFRKLVYFSKLSTAIFTRWVSDYPFYSLTPPNARFSRYHNQNANTETESCNAMNAKLALNFSPAFLE